MDLWSRQDISPPFIRWVVNYCSLISSRFLLVFVWQVKHSAASLDESSSYCYKHTGSWGVGVEDWWRWKVQLKKNLCVKLYFFFFFYLPVGKIFSPQSIYPLSIDISFPFTSVRFSLFLCSVSSCVIFLFFKLSFFFLLPHCCLRTHCQSPPQSGNASRSVLIKM